MKSRSSAVMAQRASGPDSLDLFPTPPWATRAVVSEVLQSRRWTQKQIRIVEPAAGLLHMVHALGGYYDNVSPSDVHTWRPNYPLLDFAGTSLAQIAEIHGRVDWVITNPPYVFRGVP